VFKNKFVSAIDNKCNRYYKILYEYNNDNISNIRFNLGHNNCNYDEYQMIVDSLWFYPIMGVVFLAILYWFDI